MSVINQMDRKMKILIVDDFATMRQIVKKSLRQLGFDNITEAVDGNDALNKLKADEYKFIVSDWNMPNMMGIDLLKAIRSDDKLKQLPFLMVTAEAQKENIIEAAKAGVSQYIIKPFTVDALQQKIEAIFAKKQSLLTRERRMTSNKDTPTMETDGTTTVVVSSETEHAYAEALEKILIGFGNGDLEQIREAMNSIAQGPDMLRLQERLGAIVKEFHSTVTNVKSGLDPASITMSSTNIPDAARKLEYVLNATNDATHKLFGIIERQENLISEGDAALERLKSELNNGVNPTEALAHYEADYKRWTGATHEALSEAVMTQEFQDLCGQALKKVLNLVQEMEGNLTTLLKHLGVDVNQPTEPVAEKLEQDNVDDLLKQFGF